jgi:hypothetical protein
MPTSNKEFLGLNGFVWWQGVVEDRADPLQIGRCRVRCIGWHTFDRGLIPTVDLPWAHPIAPIGPNAEVSPPKEGDWVFGFFRDGDEAQQPVYMGVIPGVKTGETKMEALLGEPDDRTLTLIPADAAGDARNVSSSGGSSGGAGGGGTNTVSGNPSNGGTVAPASGALFTFDGSQSTMCSADAEQNMQNDTLPRHARLEAACGFSIRINDAIAKSGTSRETRTPGSKHFNGLALDLSTRGLSDAQKLTIVEKAMELGYSGFGFGNTIIHLDTGVRRHWSYGNSRFGGILVSRLGAYVRNTGPKPF